jgi:membrane protein
VNEINRTFEAYQVGNIMMKSSNKARLTRFIQTIEKKAHTPIAFYIKFIYDWNWNNAAGLAYNLILAILSLVIALAALLGFFLGSLNHGAYQQEITILTNSVSSLIGIKQLIAGALDEVKKEAGLFGIVAILISIFNGSRTFVFMEGSLDIIYHVKPRNIIKQNVVAILMMLFFVLLVPLIVLMSALPTLVFTILQKTPLGLLPGGNIILSLGGILGGLLVGYLFFQIIYIIVPNQKISWHNSWRGAVVATILLELFLVLYPFYVTHFLGVFAGTLGLLLLLIFFYYFAVILFLGAEVNAFFAEGIHKTPHDLVTIVHIASSHKPTRQEGLQEQAAASHKQNIPAT